MKWIAYSFLVVLFSLSFRVNGESVKTDSQNTGASVYGYSVNDSVQTKQFYDSLEYRASRHGFTRFIYEQLIKRKKAKGKVDTYFDDLVAYRGRRIASISYQSLDVFGPSFQDTTRTTDVGIEKLANRVHMTTNERIIRKSVFVEVGDTVDVNQILENERIIRQLPYIQDVRFLIVPREGDPDNVDITVLTKDVFSFGLAVRFKGIDAATLQMYNKNIFGLGHQISAKIVTNVNKEPYIGFEGAYKIHSLFGQFLNFSSEYSNTYKHEGYLVELERQFVRTTTQWAGGLTFCRYTRADELIDYEEVPVDDDEPLSYAVLDGWGGYSFPVGSSDFEGKRLVVSGRMRHLKFYDRPDPTTENEHFFADSKLFMTSLSLSRRRFVRDYLIYSYGLTEDIPKGFLDELVLGFDNNEYWNRWYAHLFLSSGNLIRYNPAYLYASFAIGSFFNSKKVEQGEIEINFNYISRLFLIGGKHSRQFFKLRYLYGIKRFDEEALSLNNHRGIRGFYSDETEGTQKLTLNMENVIFQNRELLNFKFAFFTFADIGMIGSSSHLIFDENFYSGIGIGLRLKNENLVFQTLQFRLAYYPFAPSDINNWAFTFTERQKTEFPSFRPRKPEPLEFY